MSIKVLLKWALQLGVAVIPKSVSKKNMENNAGIASSDAFTLTEGDMALLNGMDKGRNGRLCWKNDPLRHDCP